VVRQGRLIAVVVSFLLAVVVGFSPCRPAERRPAPNAAPLPQRFRSDGALGTHSPQPLNISSRLAPFSVSKARKRRRGVLPSWAARLGLVSSALAPNSINPGGRGDAQARHHKADDAHLLLPPSQYAAGDRRACGRDVGLKGFDRYIDLAKIRSPII
jgi:hypothetical protein